jgi:hypothetical protein
MISMTAMINIILFFLLLVFLTAAGEKLGEYCGAFFAANSVFNGGFVI